MRLDGTDRQWAHWGEVEPYYAVYTDARFRKASFDDHAEAFFESGEREVADYVALQDRIYPSRPHGTMIEFGCGVGRLLIPFARRFERAVGIDIAPAMLAEAARNAEARGARNIELARSLDGFAPASFDYAHSTAVLQHVAADRQVMFARALAGLVRDGGVVSLQFGLADSEPSLLKTIKDLLRRPLEWGAIAELNRRFGIRDPNMRMIQAPCTEILAALREQGAVDLTSSFQREGSWDAVTIMARMARTR